MTVEERLANLKIGAWAAICCHRDMEQVDADNIDDIREDLLDEGGVMWEYVLPTKRELLLAIREWNGTCLFTGPEGDSDYYRDRENAEIDALLEVE